VLIQQTIAERVLLVISKKKQLHNASYPPAAVAIFADINSYHAR
jgi:hypothetical protein